MKYFKRILLLVVLLLPIIVFSKESPLEDVVIKEISGDAVTGRFRLEDGTFIPNITFKSIGDSVIYQLFLKHDTSIYELDKINDTNQNPFIKTNYSVIDDKVFLMVKYDKEVTGDFSLDSIQMNAKLKEKNVNPKTGFPIYSYFVIVFLLLIIGYYLIKKKKGFVFLLLLFPLLVYAKENSLELNISMEDIKIAYNVQFYKDDGVNGTIEEIECIYGTVCNLPVNSFQKEGNAFKGWSLEPGGEILYLDEDEVLNLASSGKVILYPVWKREYTVSFNGNGSTSGSMSNLICIEGESCTLTSNAYQRTNYLFSGWSTSANGEVLYSDGEEITIDNSLDLYAIWMSAVTNFDYTGSAQTYTIATPGRYKLEVWGAQGGTAGSKTGGRGGYSIGTLTISANTTLYVYVGGAGTSDNGTFTSCAVLAGGFNGGGYGRAWNGTSHNGGGGGGASDIRIGTDSLYARVIVAGGGGGSSDNGSGGVGGSSASYSFGSGQDTPYTGGEAGGGGGGWYGGTAGTAENYPGNGGSCYVYTSSTASSYPSGCLLNSSYYLTDASSLTGSSSFTSPSGSLETGHAGNGYARITYLGA